MVTAGGLQTKILGFINDENVLLHQNYAKVVAFSTTSSSFDYVDKSFDSSSIATVRDFYAYISSTNVKRVCNYFLSNMNEFVVC